MAEMIKLADGKFKTIKNVLKDLRGNMNIRTKGIEDTKNQINF